MSYRGPVPSGQPRTLRSIAEQKGTTPSGFHEDLPYNPKAGTPQASPGGTTEYDDKAEEAQPKPGSAQLPQVEKKPFK